MAKHHRRRIIQGYRIDCQRKGKRLPCDLINKNGDIHKDDYRHNSF